jgi:hypothetical protein
MACKLEMFRPVFPRASGGSFLDSLQVSFVQMPRLMNAIAFAPLACSQAFEFADCMPNCSLSGCWMGLLYEPEIPEF